LAIVGLLAEAGAKLPSVIAASADFPRRLVAYLIRGTNRMMSKSELIQKIADDVSLAKKDVKAVIESLATVGHKEMKKAGVFLLPGFAKFMVVKKPATKERSGINPFTKEPTVFKAKPARKILKVRPVKAAKDAV
jgi:nucleoid DNA-binding protein